MYRTIVVAVLALALSGCSDGGPPTRAYQHFQDRAWSSLGLSGLFGHSPCFRTRNGVPDRLADRECYRFLPPQRMRGVWLNDFEGQFFLPNHIGPPPQVVGTRFRMAMDRAQLSRIAGTDFENGDPQNQPKAVWVDFIGRRTQFPGGYGHFGMSEHIVVTERLLAARIVQE